VTERNMRAAKPTFFVTRNPRTLPPKHPLLKWNYVARPFCDTVDKIGESEMDVVRVRAKSTNCWSRMHV